ncbi:DNA double-strand break repair Rad50 ATPase [Thermofilum adornatum 1505]|uniref:DNA double-strand break repair Rad50 ATPase n=1 Tax=Thermofilum adornatum 1505 TaxID=697581 RepID=A0A3G1A5K7_9CREN|nr:SMC family ATPase [Thermofilum adornatum]AJB42086.1 DNA double-strand break repair Rad50 ATPase [Thermofilum adornatum 1505]
MVTIISLKANNFRRLNFKDPLYFPKGLTIIRGRNEAGKSTILEAILFGIYGDFNILREIRGDSQAKLLDVVNHASNRAKVEVTFEVEGRKFRVERIIEKVGENARQVDARLFEVTSGNDRLLASGTQRVNEEIVKLIRVDWREMIASNVIAQKDLERLIRLGKTDREKIINMFMGLESYNKAIEALQEEKRTKNAELEKKETEKKALEDYLRTLMSLEEELKKNREELQAIEQILPSLEEEEKRLSETVKYLEDLYKKLRERKSLLEKKKYLEENLKRNEEELSETRKKIELAKQGLAEAEEKLKQLQQEKEVLEKELTQTEKEYENAQSLLAKISELWNTLEESKRELENLEDEISIISEKLKTIEKVNAEMVQISEELKNTEEEIRKVRIPPLYIYSSIGLALLGLLLSILNLPAGLAILFSSLVPLFVGQQNKQKTLLYLQDKKSKLLSQRSVKEGELRLLEREREEYEKLLKRRAELEEKQKLILGQLQSVAKLEDTVGLEQYVARLQEEVEKLQKKTEELRKYYQQILSETSKTDQNIHNLKKTLEDLSINENARNKDISNIREQLKAVEEQYASIHVPQPPFEIEGLLMPVSENDVEDVEALLQVYHREYESKTREVASKKAEKNRLEQYIRQAEEQLKELPKIKEDLDRLEKEDKNLKIEVEAREKAIQILRDISSKRRSMFAPSVEQNMNWIVSYVTGGRYKAVKINPDNYDIEVYDAEAGRWMRRDIYSGGTNDQMLLAMRIAFTLALLPSAKGTYPRFLFLDEPLGSSDQERRQQIVKLLANELTRVFDQVFLITHVEIEEPPNSTLIELVDGKVAETRRITSQEEG